MNTLSSTMLIELTPDGLTKDGKWQLVPKEPTEVMKVLGCEYADPLGRLISWDPSKGDCTTRDEVAGVYKAMLSAAPSPVDSRDERDFEWKLVPIKPTLEMALADARGQLVDAKQAIRAALACLDGEPEYHEQGMGCGLEDRSITDRYDAMSHGWECAMERVYSEHINYAREILEVTLRDLESPPAAPATYHVAAAHWKLVPIKPTLEMAEKGAEVKALVERLTKALEVIAKGDTTVFDEDLQCDVEVSMDADEMSSVARAALTTKEGAAQ